MPPTRVGPYLFTITARVKKQADMDSVQKEILATVDGFKQNLVPADKLDALKKHLRYQFAMSMDNPEAVAATTARYVALRRTPETINTMYQSFQEVTPEDIRAAARKYFIENNRTIVTLTGRKVEVKTLFLASVALMSAALAGAQPQVVTVPGNSPVVTFRIVFRTGAAADPANLPGLADLTASMISEGGTRDMTYKQIVDALFPMAARVSSQVDKEMVTFSGATHVDNLEAFYKIFRG